MNGCGHGIRDRASLGRVSVEEAEKRSLVQEERERLALPGS